MTAYERTWIVVLDDSRVRFLRHEASGGWAQAAAELATSLPGTARPEERRNARARLMQQAMGVVDDACDRNQCDRIVIIGQERLLRNFRAAATDWVRVRLWRERAADTGSLTDEEIVKSVEGYFRSGPRQIA
jgi:hypothetical protein